MSPASRPVDAFVHYGSDAPLILPLTGWHLLPTGTRLHTEESGEGDNKSSGGKVAASTSYIIVIVILAVLLFASLCYIIVKQRAERAAPHSRKSMPTISEA